MSEQSECVRHVRGEGGRTCQDRLYEFDTDTLEERRACIVVAILNMFQIVSSKRQATGYELQSELSCKDRTRLNLR